MDTTVVSNVDHILYQAGTTLRDGNPPIEEKDLTFDPVTQKFGQKTSVNRMFPASKSNTTHPDDAITSLNFNVQTLFSLDNPGWMGPHEIAADVRVEEVGDANLPHGNSTPRR